MIYLLLIWILLGIIGCVYSLKKDNLEIYTEDILPILTVSLLGPIVFLCEVSFQDDENE